MIRPMNILVTGGSGSIGSEIIRKLYGGYHRLYGKPNIYSFSRNEYMQYLLKKQFPEVNIVIGDIRDQDRLRWTLSKVSPDLIYHLASMKQVDTCEVNAGEAVKTNILGTLNLLTLVSPNTRVVIVSTDKSVSPESCMGATKFIMERLMFEHSGSHAAVRLGNVLVSNGSVLPLFVEQAIKGASITVTDSVMTRFFMTIGEAADFIILSSVQTSDSLPGDIYVPKLPAMSIVDLAESVKFILKSSSPIEFIGSRPGEKLSELLVGSYEGEYVRYTDDDKFVLNYSARGNFTSLSYDSSLVVAMKVEDIIKLIRKDVLRISRELCMQEELFHES